MKKLLIFPLLIAILSTSVFAQKGFVPKPYEFKGAIKTQNGEAIAGANLYFKKDARTFTFVTDINGEFKAELSAGNYEMTVNDVLSKGFKAFIKIQDKGANPDNAVFTVNTNKNPCGLAENEVCPKPITLAEQPYPPILKALNLEGEIEVLVKIEENGNPISAKTEKGHPLLKFASENAVMRSKFEKLDKNKQTEFYVTFVYLNWKSEKKNTVKYKNSYRVEFVNIWEVVEAPIGY